MSLLDQIVFIPATMSPIAPLSSPLNLSVSFGPVGSQRPLQVSAPWTMGGATPEIVGSRWGDLCARLNQRGLILECSAAALEQVPVASIPRRLFRQPINAPLDLENIQSADILEITCHSPIQAAWGWPPEIETSENLVHWISSVRRVAGNQTPLGLGLNAGADEATIQTALDASIDFLTIHSDSNMELLVETLTRLRLKIVESKLTLPVIVRNKLKSAEQLIKLLALGAHSVTIDAFLSDIWQTSNATSSMNSFLGARIPTPNVTVPCPINERLEGLQSKLTEIYNFANATSAGQLHRSLRALTPLAAQLTGLPLLGKN